MTKTGTQSVSGHKHTVSGKSTSNVPEPPHTHPNTELDPVIADLNARIAALEKPPVVGLPGWNRVFLDTFDRTVAKPDFTKGGTVVRWTAPSGTLKTAGVKTFDGRYIAFGSSPGASSNWIDTSGHGTYADSTIISIANGVLDMEFFADAAGFGHTCVITPLPAGGSIRGGLPGFRALVTVRADPVVGFKAAILGWADDAETNSDLMKKGEIDFPEGPFTEVPKYYLNKINAPSLTHESSSSTPAGTRWTDWHDYLIEWLPGVSVAVYCDGVLLKKDTDRVPIDPMHYNLQFETNTGSGPWPAPNARGHIQIKRVELWTPS